MSHRRMFSPDIVESEEFLDMPHSSQSLYFHLAMRADDDGFVQPKMIMRLTGANNDDLKVLLAKRFLLSFETGVVVVKHWLIHNMIRKDRYKETRFVNEKRALFLKENSVYTDNKDKGKKLLATKWQPNGNHSAPQVRLGKVRLGKDSNNSEETSQDSLIPEIIKSFEDVNPTCKTYYGNKTQRKACQFLIEEYGFEKVKKVIQDLLPKTNGIEFMPTITTPVQLKDKWASLETAVKRKQSEVKNNKTIVW